VAVSNGSDLRDPLRRPPRLLDAEYPDSFLLFLIP
jgi:hypothetical protein